MPAAPPGSIMKRTWLGRARPLPGHSGCFGQGNDRCECTSRPPRAKETVMTTQAAAWTIRRGKKHARIARVARAVLVGSGILAAVLGVLVVLVEPQVLPVHEL